MEQNNIYEKIKKLKHSDVFTIYSNKHNYNNFCCLYL